VVVATVTSGSHVLFFTVRASDDSLQSSP
jgi:hypothetical protein